MNRSRGVALMTALIVVAIATAIAAAIFFDTGLVLRRSEGASGQERALLLAGGAEALAARILGEDLDTGNAPIHPGQRWANPLGPIEVEDAGVLQGQLIDLQGRFNLNSLVDKDGRIDPVALEIFERLLRVLQLETAWAPKFADWIDADDLPISGGAEDDVYTSLRPGYRPPNRPVTSISELLLLPGFDVQRFARLAPHVAALPRDASINLCTATPALLDALARDFVKHRYDVKHLMRTILESRLYQLSTAPNASNVGDTRQFSRAYRRRLPAEVLLEAVNAATGVPDTFSGLPPGAHASQAWTYKIESQLMDAFSRPNPSSDPPCERDRQMSVVQSLHLMNSKGLQAKLSHPAGRARRLAEGLQAPAEIITELYLAALSRFPTAEEMRLAAATFSAPGATRPGATEDVLWALINSAEFVFNH